MTLYTLPWRETMKVTSVRGVNGVEVLISAARIAVAKIRISVLSSRFP